MNHINSAELDMADRHGRRPRNLPKRKLPDPIEAIKFRMEQMGWSAADLARLTGYQTSHISEYLNRKRKITLGFIRAYHKVADATPLEVLVQDYKL